MTFERVPLAAKAGSASAPARRPMVKLLGRSRPAPLGSPPAVWAAFLAQGRWKSWTIVALLGLLTLQAMALVRITTRPPEVVVVGSDGSATPVRRTVATDALLRFLADHTRPPDPTVVRFTRDFLTRALAVNSDSVEVAWPEALAMMSPDLRTRAEAEGRRTRLVETWRAAERRTELAFDELSVEDRAPTALSIKAILERRTTSLVDQAAGAATDRVRVDLLLRTTPQTMDRPDGLEVTEWRVTPLPVAIPRSKLDQQSKGVPDAP